MVFIMLDIVHGDIRSLSMYKQYIMTQKVSILLGIRQNLVYRYIIDSDVHLT